jgi:FAD/FMN-containing dehydrogenase
MEALQKCIDEISRILEPDQVSGDIATRITYRAAHGPETLLHEDLSEFTPGVVVRPKSTEDVAKVVKIANEYSIPIVPQGGEDGGR